MIEMVTPTGEKHGLINVLGNSCEDNSFKHMKPAVKAKAEKQKEEDHKTIKARYINYRSPNERLSKPYCRWAGDPIQMWHFIPNHVYEVPKGLVEEVNDPNKRRPQRSDLLDRNGVPTKKDGPGIIEHEFVPVSF